MIAFLGIIFFVILSSCVSKAPECDAGYAIIHNYAKKKYKEDNWNLFGIGGSFPDGDIRGLNVSFWVDQKVTLEQARVAIIKAINEFLAQINNDPKAKPYLNHFPFNARDLRFSIVFHNINTSYVKDREVSYVSMIKGSCSYYKYDEKKKGLIEFHEEAYEEAFKIVENSTLTANGIQKSNS